MVRKALNCIVVGEGDAFVVYLDGSRRASHVADKIAKRNGYKPDTLKLYRAYRDGAWVVAPIERRRELARLRASKIAKLVADYKEVDPLRTLDDVEEGFPDSGTHNTIHVIAVPSTPPNWLKTCCGACARYLECFFSKLRRPGDVDDHLHHSRRARKIEHVQGGQLKEGLDATGSRA